MVNSLRAPVTVSGGVSVRGVRERVFGLPLLLIAIGLLLVRFRGGLDRLGKPGSHWQRLLPLVSAVIVTMLGVGIVLKGLMSYVS
jgi:hypothetical protein